MSFTPRSQINQVFQIGAEPVGTPGVGGSADQRLGTFNTQIAPVASGTFGVFRPSGGKYVGQIVPTDIYAEGAFTDTIDYNTLPFIAAGNVGYVAPTGSVAKTWRFTPVPFAQGTQRSFIAQEGQVGAVYNYNNIVIPDFNMRFMRTGASQAGGRILGRRLAPGTTITSASLRQGRAINSIKTGIWEADTWAHLATGATRLSPVALDLAWRHNGIFAPWFALDDSITSFGGTLEEAADSGIQISVMADVDTDDYAGVFNFASMEDGSDIYLKCLTTGILITGSIYYLLEIDMHAQISGPPRKANVGSLRVWQWDALLTPDATSGLPFDITCICTTPATAMPES